MTLPELNKAIAKCDPYNDKELRRYLVGQRRKKENRNQRNVRTNNLPSMLVTQSGL